MPQIRGGPDPSVHRQPAQIRVGADFVQASEGNSLQLVPRRGRGGTLLRVVSVGQLRLRQGWRLRVLLYRGGRIRQGLQLSGGSPEVEVHWNLWYVENLICNNKVIF